MLNCCILRYQEMIASVLVCATPWEIYDWNMEFDSFLLFWSFDGYWSQHLCKLDCTHFLLIFLLCLGWGCCKGYRRLSRSTRGTHMSGKRGKQCCWKICWDSFCFVWLFLIQSEKVFYLLVYCCCLMNSFTWKLEPVNLVHPANSTTQNIQVDPWVMFHWIYMDTRYDRFEFFY